MAALSTSPDDACDLAGPGVNAGAVQTFADGRLTKRTRELVAGGMTRSQIAWAVGHGQLVRVRIGHYSLPGLDRATQQAIRVGGFLACVSELRRRGVWVTSHDSPVHVHVRPHGSRLRRPDDRTHRFVDGDAVLHWEVLTAQPSDARVAILDALRQSAGCLSGDDWIATVDSALHQGMVRLGDVRRSARARDAALLRWVDRRAESGLESLIRVPLRRAGIRVIPQARIPGVGRVDLLVEGAVAVELDGRAFHGLETAPRDRRRDAAAARARILPLRFDYAQVIHDRPSVIRAIAGALVSHRNVRGSGRSQAIRLLRRPDAGIS